MEQISSRSNPKIKLLRALRERRARQEARLFLVEGIRHVGEAADSKAKIESIYFDPQRLRSPYALELIERQSGAGVPCYQLASDVFGSVAEKENPQGILAVVHEPQINLKDLNPTNFPWGVALDSPQDPGNLGTILRTIDAVGASGMILLGNSADPFHPSAVRASMGAIFWLQIVQVGFVEFHQWVKHNGYHLYGSSARAECDYLEASPYLLPRILLLGSEREGLSPEQRQVCELVVGLPMCGHGSSLNLSVATGILLYAMLPGSTSH